MMTIPCVSWVAQTMRRKILVEAEEKRHKKTGFDRSFSRVDCVSLTASNHWCEKCVGITTQSVDGVPFIPMEPNLPILVAMSMLSQKLLCFLIMLSWGTDLEIYGLARATPRGKYGTICQLRNLQQGYLRTWLVLYQKLSSADVAQQKRERQLSESIIKLILITLRLNWIPHIYLILCCLVRTSFAENTKYRN